MVVRPLNRQQLPKLRVLAFDTEFLREVRAEDFRQQIHLLRQNLAAYNSLREEDIGVWAIGDPLPIEEREEQSKFLKQAYAVDDTFPDLSSKAVRCLFKGIFFCCPLHSGAKMMVVGESNAYYLADTFNAFYVPTQQGYDLLEEMSDRDRFRKLIL